MRWRSFLLLPWMLAMLSACGGAMTAPSPTATIAIYRDPAVPIPARVEDLLQRMTLAEKIGQMTLIEKNSLTADQVRDLFIGGVLSGGGGYPATDNSPAAWAEMVNTFQHAALSTRLGIPIIYGADGVHGHNNLYGAVIFPHNIGLGAANNPVLVEQIGRATATEMAATGVFWNYAPGVMVVRDVRWGRTYEGYAERPDHVATLAAAFVRGLQAPDIAAPNRVIGTPKHYLGDGGTAWGSSTTENYQLDQGETMGDEAILRAVHLPPYRATIAAGAQVIMASYSSWNGQKMHASSYWLSDVLKQELGFSGFVVSDWAAIDQIDPTYDRAVITAINAGIDMNMVPYDARRFINALTRAVEAGAVSEERINDAVRRILTVKFAMGLFEQPFAQTNLLPQIGSTMHRELARTAVAESLVLLKNEQQLLPLTKDIRHLYIGGQAANDLGIQAGGWTIEWQGRVGSIIPGTTILAGIQAAVSPQTVVEYNEHGRFTGDPGAADAVCIAVVGELPYAEGRGDSASLSLPINEQRVLYRMEETCARLVVVLIAGRPLIVTDSLPRWDALVVAWLPGSEGAGVADVLFGDRPFRGRLPVTWPRSLDQLPLGSGNGEPLFPYGFGLTP
ncbi:glycoside hydrolase family 3 N-terminal domain-containing protein [uncultured Chloroflexus sp.]|uniref:glycoside hydrolase family 3 protein n=1 Tax=uncultured Chloroflexus sp. TaxID=214040 RepID=UPI0026319174|nr:glycoside hydrolase family 3 N-terminal domain-containing protein [uncultured Chloroflexus sp.]